MYLLILPNSVYYTRIATPLPVITSSTLTEFIQSKQLEGVTQLTLTQLEQRQRWKTEDLQKLLSSDAYRKQNTNFKWITLLMLYQGCRPSEACQFQVPDIKQSGALHSVIGL
ncbi:hypothetical protein ACU5EH_17445 [Aliivibrio salmonicida]|uniref:hypothetical protein n=1 Tax=Aliivibrio salmonicida TaxID=40269 RepID=UPI00406CA884